MQIKLLKEQDKIRGRVIKKSIDLYLTKRPIITSYDVRGKAKRKYYKRKDLARDLGVTTRTINSWETIGRMNRLMKIKLSKLRIVPMRIW